MPTFLRNKLSDLSEEMLCGSLQFLGIISLFLPCLQDPFPQISTVVSAGNPVVSSMMTSQGGETLVPETLSSLGLHHPLETGIKDSFLIFI